MKLLEHITDTDVLEEVPEPENETFRTRKTARAVILDGKNNIALLYGAKYDYYTLPGGGVKTGESVEDALHRECREEAGCTVEILIPLGIITEYRHKWLLEQISYIYLVRLCGKKKTPKWTDSEKEENLKCLWVPPEKALKKICESKSGNYDIVFTLKRDIVTLEESLKVLSTAA
jgi:ADP-ribose pyrophosphatase YjhB (NUDIX family)